MDLQRPENKRALRLYSDRISQLLDELHRDNPQRLSAFNAALVGLLPVCVSTFQTIYCQQLQTQPRVETDA
jgi:hypothetical protein